MCILYEFQTETRENGVEALFEENDLEFMENKYIDSKIMSSKQN